jgi:hypothetical protein
LAWLWLAVASISSDWRFIIFRLSRQNFMPHGLQILLLLLLLERSSVRSEKEEEEEEEERKRET